MTELRYAPTITTALNTVAKIYYRLIIMSVKM